jgi:hypothetical protein
MALCLAVSLLDSARADEPVQYDGYSPAPTQEVNVYLGTYVMSSGVHHLTFRVIDKNPASLGYRVGIDTLTVSPCGAPREAEAQLPPSVVRGVTASAAYMGTDVWSGAYGLIFPATATGQYFTLAMENDRWEETNFRGEGATGRQTVVYFDPYANPTDFVVQLEGPGYSWLAAEQGGVTNSSSSSSNAFSNCAVRILIRGGEMTNGEHVKLSGKGAYVLFMASDVAALSIRGAFIAEAANPTNYTANAAAEGTRLWFFNSFAYTLGQVTIPAGGNWWATTQSNYPIDSAKSYVITFLAGSNGNAACWAETHSGAPGAYVIPASAGPSLADIQAADWSARAFFVTNTSPGVYGVYTTYPTNGTFTSQILDTHLDAPAYTAIGWHAQQPTNTKLRIKVRTGSQADLSDAPAWSNATAMTAPGNLTAGDKRYVQFQSILDPDFTGWFTPRLKDVTVRWTGETRTVALFGTFLKGSDLGIFEVLVDREPREVPPGSFLFVR